MNDSIEVSETIKKEDGKFNLYTKDGKKLLGQHDSMADAQKQESAINIAKSKESDAGLVKDVASGAVEISEGGRYVINEDAGDLARMSDAQLKKTRSTMVDKRNEKRNDHAALPDMNKYSSPEGSAILDDLYYYNQIVSRLECEMACRMLTLD